jgi:hypothetical protein
LVLSTSGPAYILVSVAAAVDWYFNGLQLAGTVNHRTKQIADIHSVTGRTTASSEFASVRRPWRSVHLGPIENKPD